MLYRFSRDSTDRGCTEQGGAGLVRAMLAEQEQGDTGLDKAQAEVTRAFPHPDSQPPGIWSRKMILHRSG